MKRLTCEEKQEIRQILIEDNKRIYDEQTLGNQNQAVNAKRAKHLRPEAYHLQFPRDIAVTERIQKYAKF